jgi:hypothetical protein
MQDEATWPMSGFLTSDNSYLSRPKLALAHGSAINCPDDLADAVVRYVRASLADNTRRAYLSDLAHFESWGGRIPASAETVASYLAAHAGTLRVATLVRRIASISRAHQARGVPNPTRSELVRTTLRRDGAPSSKQRPCCARTFCWCWIGWVMASKTSGIARC